jgi:cytochrome c oxidase cbb3-type subunit 1
LNLAEAKSAHFVRQHSLFWLVAANSVGVLLSITLLWPEFGDRLAPFTYGRWIPLHLDWQLYGWCSLPLVGVLLHWVGHGATAVTARLNRVALWAWSIGLAAAGVSWLSGVSSGKIFVDWQGWARPLLPAAMTILWLSLVWQFWTQRHALKPLERALQAGILLLLFLVPPALFWASGREVYPSVNPDSGGATGASLLASTLGILAIYGLVPVLLSQPAHRPDSRARQRTFWLYFVLAAIVYLLIDHGNASSKSALQEAGLGVLVIWIPLAWQYFNAYDWPPSARRWLIAAFGWWVLLVVSGFLFFLPGLSERLKFTNGLVAHAHLALAGLVTCFNIAILNLLAPTRPITRGFWLWQGALALHIAALTALGWTEYSDPAVLFLGRSWSQACYGLRLAAGLVMWLASLSWLFQQPRSAGLDR